VPVPPSNQSVPGQERGVRHARAIPCTLQADGLAGATSVRINFRNSGRYAGHLEDGEPSISGPGMGGLI
jgi:phospholipase C